MTVATAIELYRLWCECKGRDWGPADPCDRDGFLKKHQLRERCRREFAYAIPTEPILAFLAHHAPFVEIGAGTGYWASLLIARGADVVAYDSNIAGDHEDWTYCAVDTPYMPIRKGGPERAADYPDRTLLLIWPPYAEPMAHDALRAFTGRTLVYIGEGDGGCTGDDAFHALIDAEWDEIADHAVPQWWGLHDHLWIYRRKGAARLP
jgi:hypothetical protein